MYFLMDWIEKYENTTRDYRLTQTKSVETITLSFIYTINNSLPFSDNKKQELDIKESINVSYKLNEPGILSKDELLELLIQHKKSYNSYKIMKFNINSEGHEEFIYDDEHDFSSHINGVNNINFDNTLGIFDDLNIVYIIFMHRNKNKFTLKNKHSKKIKKTYRSYNLE